MKVVKDNRTQISELTERLTCGNYVRINVYMPIYGKIGP